MPSNSRSGGYLLVILFVVVLAVLFGTYSCIYNTIEQDCLRRGGHMEHVIGGRGGSVCEGATR